MLGRLFREAVARVSELRDFSDSLASGGRGAGQIPARRAG